MGIDFLLIDLWNDLISYIWNCIIFFEEISPSVNSNRKKIFFEFISNETIFSQTKNPFLDASVEQILYYLSNNYKLLNDFPFSSHKNIEFFKIAGYIEQCSLVMSYFEMEVDTHTGMI